jgi:hypothetical protein
VDEQPVTDEEQHAAEQTFAKLIGRLIHAAKDNKSHGTGRHLAAGCRHCAAVFEGRAFIQALGPDEPKPPGELVEYEEAAA